MKSLPNLFLVVLDLPEKLKKDTMYFKKMAEDTLKHSYPSRYSVPHVTVDHFEDFHNESKLYDRQDIIVHTKPFKIFVDGFQVFESSGTIYLRPVFDNELRTLCKQLSGGTTTPHITIARNLPSKDRDKLWDIFQKLQYRHEFICESIIVLKRMNGHWQKHMEIKLQDPILVN
jgi:2'-5' RNA ligase